MPSTHKLVIGSLSRRSNSNAVVQVPQLSGGRDTAETRREANDQRINRVPLDDAEGSTDEEDDLCSAGGENPLGTSRILDAESRQHLLLAINRAPEKRLRQAFEALASIVDNIPEDTFRMLVRQETARNASGPQLPQEAVAQQQRAGHNHKHLAIVAPAPGATYGEGYQRIYTSQELKDAQSPNHEVHRAAPYIHPAYQMIPRPEVRQWQYLHQPNPQNLPQVPQRQPQGNPAPGPNNALGAVNTPYRPLDLAAARVHYENMARSALSQFNSAQNVAVPVPVPGYVHGRYAMTPSVWRGNAPVYAPPVPPALPGAPDAPRATLIPPLLMAWPHQCQPRQIIFRL